VTDSDRLPASQIAEVYEQWASDVRAFLRALVRDPEQAEELLQATFARLVEVGHAVQSSSMRAWLFRVAHNEAMLWRRRNGVHTRALRGIVAVGHHVSLQEPSEIAVSRENVERVRLALAELPAEQRQVVEQRIHGERTFAEIATEIGVPLGTVLTRMRLALVKLGRRLRDE
jgi:RNA polymerase sigma factor (sigma-70 family)